MKHRSKQTRIAKARAPLAACLSLLFALPVAAQGDLTGGVGQFAIQPKKPKAVASAKPNPPNVPRGPRATKNDRLLDAAGGGDAAAVKNSVKAGADVNVKTKDEGCAALVYVAAAADASATQSLLAEGADANARCTNGVTALMVAAEAGNAE